MYFSSILPSGETKGEGTNLCDSSSMSVILRYLFSPSNSVAAAPTP